jgi:hypothetical protein
MITVVNRLQQCLLVTAITSYSLAGQARSVPESTDTTCNITRPRIKLPCPANWKLLDNEDDATVIANFKLTPDNQKKRSGPGMATISVFSIPKGYDDLARWIRVGRKNAPDAIETKLTVVNLAGAKVQVVCLTSPESSGPVFASYFFQIGRTPVLLEISYRAQDPNKDEYSAAARWMIERAVFAR